MDYSNLRTAGGQQVKTLSNGMADVNAILSGMVSRDPWKYYDSLMFAPGATLSGNPYAMFNAPLNSTDPYTPYTSASQQTKTKVQTNNPSSCSQGFAGVRDLLMDSIGFYFRNIGILTTGPDGTHNTALDDIALFCSTCYFEFKIQDKIFYEGMLEFKPGGMGIDGYSTTSGQQNYHLGMNNIHAVDRVRPEYSKYLAPLLPWSLNLFFPPQSGPSGAAPVLLTAANGGAGLWLVAWLGGVTDRAIQ